MTPEAQRYIYEYLTDKYRDPDDDLTHVEAILTDVWRAAEIESRATVEEFVLLQDIIAELRKARATLARLRDAMEEP